MTPKQTSLFLAAPALALSAGLLPMAARTAARPDAHSLQPSPNRKLISGYCVPCHQGKDAAGGLDISLLDPDRPDRHAREWEKTIIKLQAGMMPPAGAPRPSPAAVKQLISVLGSDIDRYAADYPNPGSPALHRLNRTEYANSVRNLLNLDVDVSALLPPDDMSHGFDNMAEVLNVSPTLLAGYIRAAGVISRAAVGEPNAQPSEQIYHVPSTLSQTGHIEGTPFGTRGGIVIHHNFPADGQYIFRLKFYFTTNTFLFGMNQKNEKIEVAVNGERVALFNVNPMMKGDEDLRTPPIKVKAGPQIVTAAFIQQASGPVEDLVEPFDHSLGDLFLGRTTGLTGLPHLCDLSINGPFHPTGVSDTPSRQRIFIAHPDEPADELPLARKILGSLARQAYRRPVTDEDLQELLHLYTLGRNRGGFEEGIRLGLQFILASPNFVFRFERTPQTVAAGQIYPITDLELASRLSYFLWSSGPDAELLNVAAAGKLSRSGVLEHEVRRMLVDRRSEALAHNFAGEWLHLRNLQDVQPDLFAFPNANANLLQAMRQETELFFTHIVQADRPVTELLTADYTFVNGALAKHYGIPDVAGPRFRQVSLVDDDRRGLLGQASILTVTSFANRTSPVLRGKWVLDNLLGAPPPRQPANVPPFKETTDVANPLTVRQRLEEHRKNPACASCHTMMDPIGFALESFDATGAYRAKDGGLKIDSRAQLTDGTWVSSPSDLRRDLVAHSDAFISTFTQKLLSYALGRGTEYYDMPAVREIDHEAAGNGNRFSSYVLGIVKSVPFRLRKAGGSVPSPAQVQHLTRR